MSDIDDEIRPGRVVPGEEQAAIHVRRYRGANAQNNRLREIGERLVPDGMQYIGSIGTHIYTNGINGQVAVVSQNCTDDATINQANFALQQTAFEIAKSYGWKPPATRQDIMQKDIHRGGLIVPANLVTKPTIGATTNDNTNTNHNDEIPHQS